MVDTEVHEVAEIDTQFGGTLQRWIIRRASGHPGVGLKQKLNRTTKE